MSDEKKDMTAKWARLDQRQKEAWSAHDEAEGRAKDLEMQARKARMTQQALLKFARDRYAEFSALDEQLCGEDKK